MEEWREERGSGIEGGEREGGGGGGGGGKKEELNKQYNIHGSWTVLVNVWNWVTGM